jgi:hypothetical protein
MGHSAKLSLTVIFALAAAMVFAACASAALAPPSMVPNEPNEYTALAGRWHFTEMNGTPYNGENGEFYMVMAGSRYEVWTGEELSETGTFAIRGGTMYSTKNNGETGEQKIQLIDGGMTLMLSVEGYSLKYRRVQADGAVWPQTAPPKLDGRWQRVWNGSPMYLVFLGNRYQLLDNTATAEQGTFVIQGVTIDFTPDGKEQYMNYLTVSPDGSSMTTDGSNSSTEWRKIS